MEPGLTVVGFIWSALSLLTSGILTMSYYAAYWLVGGWLCDQQGLNCTRARFGTFRRCGFPTIAIDGLPEMSSQCGRYASFQAIPSPWWQATTVVMGLGAAITCLCAFLTLPACCAKDVLSRSSARAVGLAQAVIGFFILTSCLLYPLGWNVDEVKHACGSQASPYSLGDCRVGWCYWTSFSCVLMQFLCAALAWKAGKPFLWTSGAAAVEGINTPSPPIPLQQQLLPNSPVSISRPLPPHSSPTKSPPAHPKLLNNAYIPPASSSLQGRRTIAHQPPGPASPASLRHYYAGKSNLDMAARQPLFSV